MAVLLTRRAVVQVAMETTYNTAVAMTDADGVLVSEPMYTADPSILERDFTRDTLSQLSHVVGRLLSKMEFSTELRGSGSQNSGLVADAPLIARLFRACGYTLTAHNAPHASVVFQEGDHLNPVAWARAFTAVANKPVADVIQYTVLVTTPGASGTAKVTILSDVTGQGTDEQSITTATELTLGDKGLKLTPTFTGDLVEGQLWNVWLLPKGLALSPTSSNEESITLEMNKDGVLHKMPGTFGTFEIDATAGEYATVKWTFMGTYAAPVDQVLATPNYEKTLPAQVERARLFIDGKAHIVEKFTFNQANDVQIRPDVNGEQGYIGTRIVGRKPEGGIDPEATLVADYDFWGKLRNAHRMPFQMRVGTKAGNTVWLLAPSVQYTSTTYSDRQGLLTYDAGLKFAGYAGDDEVQLYLT